MRALAITVTVLLTYGAIPPQAQADPGRARGEAVSAIAWAPCPEDGRVQCGTMSVPADWDDPYGAVTSLTIARRPATDPASRIGALFVNPGGPGGSAVDFTFDAPKFFGAEVRQRFDIVGMDPRGVGRSSPVLCAQDLVDAKPSPMIGTEAAYDATIAYNRRLAADCAARTGPVFAHVDTGSVVRDMDAVREALGEDTISFYGASYGSLIGEEYAERYPRHLRALALDGVMDHSVDLATFLDQETAAAEDSFREFVAWCARDERCVLRGQDIPALWASLMARARAGTLENPYDPPAKLDPAGLIQAAFAAFYDPQWYSFAYYLRDAAGLGPKKGATPRESGAAKGGNAASGGGKAREGGVAKGGNARSGGTAVDVTPYSFAPVICVDWYLPVTGFADLRARLDAMAARYPSMLASPLAANAVAGCLGWPAPPANPQRKLVPPPGLPPILLVGTRHDPATAYVWAQQVAAQLAPHVTLLTYEGWGHVVYKNSTCVSDAVDKYLLTLVPPAPGTTCPAIEPEPYGVG